VAADADFRTGRAVVTYDPAQTNPEQIVQAFNSQSFYRASVAAGEGGSATTIESLTGPEAQPASSSGAADVIYTAIGFGKYVLWGLVGLALTLLGWRVVGKRLLRVQIRTTEE